MCFSAARQAANRANALRSTGPKTPEGKAISRRNSFKHGMTGEGIVVHPEDLAEVARREAALKVELGPKTEMGGYFVGRLAELLMTRVERCSRQEIATVSALGRNAEAAYDDKRLSEIEHMLSWIATEPATFVRRLLTSYEGIDAMIERFEAVKRDVSRPDFPPDYNHMQLIENLRGRHAEDPPMTRTRALFRALHGDMTYLEPGEAAGFHRGWAVARLVEIIDDEVEALRLVRETIDPEAVERDRAEAGDRALFDPSKEAILARKYEAAAERGVYRALRELREVEAEAAAKAEARAEAAEELASSGTEAEEEAEPEVRVAPPRPVPTPQVPSGRIGSVDDGPRSVGWTGPGRS